MSFGNKTAEISIPKLRAAITGRVITPEDPEYDTVRTIFPGGIDRRPAAIIQAADANDVSRVVTFARETGVELAVRSGGHSIYGISEGGIVLDLRQLKTLDIDVEQRTAWAGSGLTAGEYTAAAGAYGLATGFGDTGSVGIGGITLGGGVGFLVRKYGLTIDSLLAAEIVTADGQIVYTDANTHPDLFWAIRGGGGNFGVITRFQFRLHEVDTIVGGILILPASPEILLSFVAAAEAAPEELSAIINVMIAPPMPFVPSEYHGKLITMAMMVYAGEVEAGQRAIAPFRAIATPISDMIRPMSYAEMYPPEQEGFHPVAASRTMFLDTIDQHTTEIIFEHLRASTAMMAATQIRVLGGASARVSDDATAYAHRTRRMMVNLAAMYQQPDQAAVHETWVKDFAEALHQSKGAYVNFLVDEGEERVREAYPGDIWDRLAAIKARYDPTNLFHLNQNIVPAK